VSRPDPYEIGLEPPLKLTVSAPFTVRFIVVITFALRLLVKTLAVERPTVDPLNVPPGAAPFIEETLSAKLERIWKRPVPTTSRVAAGAAVPTPTFDEEPAM
jgi:hypothetical protein